MKHFELNLIGAFQFDNLILNRIPFLLLNFGTDLSKIYSGVFDLHLQNHVLQTNSENFLNDIKTKNLPPHFAIVVICENGKVSSQAAKQLEQNGFSNVYCVRGGRKELLTEKSITE